MINLHEGEGAKSEHFVSLVFSEMLPDLEKNFDEITRNLAHLQGFRRGSLTYEEIITGEDKYHDELNRLGWDDITQLIEENAGVRIEITLAEPAPIDQRAAVGERLIVQGLLTDISGGRRAAKDNTPFFDGMAVLRERGGKQSFVAISLGLDGVGHLLANEYQPTVIPLSNPQSIFGKS